MHIEILIKEIRKNKRITLKSLSKMSGYSTTHINDIENNIKIPSLYVMVALAKSLKVDIKETYKVKK